MPRYRYHVGTRGASNADITCHASLDDALKELQDAGRDFAETIEKRHADTCRRCRPALEEGNSVDCRRLDPSYRGLGLSSFIADGDAAYRVNQHGGFEWKLSKTHWIVRAVWCYGSGDCNHRRFPGE